MRKRYNADTAFQRFYEGGGHIPNEIPVLIQIKSVAHREEMEQDEKMNLLVSGTLQLDEDHAVIRYDELTEDTIEHVVMDFCKDMVTVNRTGDFVSQLCFRMACRSEGTYQTPFGEIELGVFTTRLSYDINELEGSLFLSYQMDMNGHFAAVHNIEMHVLKQIEKPKGKQAKKPQRKEQENNG